MSALTIAIRRECRVAFSRHGQPVWFRILKWGLALPLVWWVWRTAWFWETLAGMTMLGLVVHFLYRWKTAGWTRPWGGWNDVKSADGLR